MSGRSARDSARVNAARAVINAHDGAAQPRQRVGERGLVIVRTTDVSTVAADGARRCHG